MILVVDLCYRDGSLSRDEFVRPVEQILEDAGTPSVVCHYTAVTAQDIEAADAAILCGTALKDAGFAEHPERFRWLLAFQRPVLGISSGMRALAAAFGGDTVPCYGIGMTDVRVLAPDPLFSGKEVFPAYEVHEYAVQAPAGFVTLAVSDACVLAIRHRSRPMYGLLFFPEVRNEWIIERFIELSGMASPGDL